MAHLDWSVPNSLVDGYAPNGILVGYVEQEYIAYVVYSKRQAREALVAYDQEQAAVLKCQAAFEQSVLPEESEMARGDLKGFCAHQAWLAMDQQGHLPDDHPIPLGLIRLVTPEQMGPDDPFILCIVNASETSSHMYVFASLEQFEAVIARHAAVITAAKAEIFRTELTKGGLPLSSELAAVHVQGYIGNLLGAGFNVMAYVDAQPDPERPIELLASATEASQATRRMRFISVPAPSKTDRMNGSLFFYAGSDYTVSIFHSKQQGITLAKAAHHPEGEQQVFDRLNDCALPNTSRRKVLTIEGAAAETLHDAFDCHLHTHSQPAEQAHDAQIGHKEFLDPFFPKSAGEPEAVLAVMLSTNERLVYVCYSRQQVKRLLKKHADRLDPLRRKLIASGVDASHLPESSPKSLVVIEDTAAFSLYRGLRLLLLKRMAN